MKKILLALFLLVSLRSFADDFGITVKCTVPFTLEIVGANIGGDKTDKKQFREEGGKEEYFWPYSTNKPIVIVHLETKDYNEDFIMIAIGHKNTGSVVFTYSDNITLMFDY